ncbi:heparinase [Rhizobium rhizosphaerae]|uniref:Heparinase n=1 Tax=Xaviernesmea rhizosphaerae TaxID=1672749 RepID=A0A1Q9AGB5_9HYPH|nr:heparinase II/III family protein [Xaviernesmea rhizosphaerae]OLP54005.1 heparinase [Xaviernesmea rhizosphaerae]
MSSPSSTDRRRLLYLYTHEAWRRVSHRLLLGRRTVLRFSGPAPDRLIVAPTDLRVVDPYAAQEILEGRFPLAGRVLETEGRSPFEIDLPSRAFAVSLHSFGWVRHMRTLTEEEDYAALREIFNDWFRTHGRRFAGSPSWEPETIARRVIAWLSHSPVILKNAERNFYRRFLKSLSFQLRFLRHIADTAPEGQARLRVRIALAMASIAMPASPAAIRKAARQLDHELDRQILPDGSHCSRNPRSAMDLLFDLLPLRQTYVNLGHDVPARLIPCIDRMYPALRFFRHRGGELALFNGATATLANELMSVLRYDETGGAPFKALPNGRYERLSFEDVVVIMDVGTPLSPALSRTAHAGCLSFELSSGQHRFIINSGAPSFAGERYRQMARSTAAHSTVTLDDQSSARLSRSAFLGPIVTGGLTHVDSRREQTSGGADSVVAVHDGYYKLFGLKHERDLALHSAGTLLRGRDRFLGRRGAAPGPDCPHMAVARFHVHPAIRLERQGDHEVALVAPDGDCWIFSCVDLPVEIEEDVFFADPSGVRPSQQLTLTFALSELAEIQWTLERDV